MYETYAQVYSKFSSRRTPWGGISVCFLPSKRGLTDSQLHALVQCVANGRLGQGITYATSTLFMYDYLLTVWDEFKFVWRPRKITISSVAFFLSRYAAMAGAIVVLVPGSETIPAISSTGTVLRLVSIVASEFIVAVRTWAIWGRNRKILLTLAFFSLAAIIPAAIIIGEDVVSSHVQALVSDEFIDICSLTLSNIDQGFVVPYILTILYESVTLTLSLIRILNWRKTIPKNIRAPIIDNLWRDGVLYFTFMLLLGFMNIGIVSQQGVPQIRTGGSQLQAVIHSILSTRIVLHLANSKDSRDITAPGSSVYTSRAIQFTSQFSTTMDAERFPHGDVPTYEEDG
ncbi:hypothetical protein GYMLUDRAFT_823759 [Collybiopsis luxurians FD-317 M1]|uniref:DUF6533 domain-containing protein n=1 Tax=Collybiopsis luxurians FD-317 M1 TaxID=944289 RepID=A0A0D0CLP9_9AGAR|nr:hypothetical protein GYMLUDRAFT_823759 [Collybiopsis luxurians FD-317 M1]